ncbi:beta-ketoacyl synthase N-terminal-like domain-containing protein [Roseospira visakhapatnamensis]|uniref:3-oxoacyl-(Acyl-carrier-protein) synthase n=1 Tax=Roseospira visakhapatnamensis TaxID=390880 RepID=A0A7W6WA53_9PROT|nr:beta-ketoacyl synthase N-terminal-like domain-containing protein [Roseospira visakhapatnamensis]MBB4266508.1 3-oxoacyl-(acyl-carrier-protein) synthase [Roseospira visakhapatnamensis]
MTRDVVITGMGVVLPKTRSLDALWHHVGTPGPHVERLSSRIAGSRIDESAIAEALPPRLSRKLDAFTRYALIATQSAIEDAALALDGIDRERCGAFVGNCFGGWRFTERELRHLHGIGPRAVSPFQATSWFPAAPQGQITIVHGLKGFSKTYMADRMSSLVSVASAASLIRRGQLDVAIAGGAESTNTDFVRAALERIAAANGEPDPAESGFQVSEGAVFLVLEDAGHARARGARVYAGLRSFAMRNAPSRPDQYAVDPRVLEGTMRRVLGNLKADIVLPDASGLARVDACEQAALDTVCPGVPALRPKGAYGHAFGAEGALDVVFASLMLHRQQRLPTVPSGDDGADLSSARSGTARDARQAIERILINACAMGGGAGSLLLTKES